MELAFDYRGDVTVVRADGTALTGYVYNRDRDAVQPFLELFDPTGAAHTVPYADIRTIHFTGRDAAAGRSFAAWRERRAPVSPPPPAGR